MNARRQAALQIACRWTGQTGHLERGDERGTRQRVLRVEELPGQGSSNAHLAADDDEDPATGDDFLPLAAAALGGQLPGAAAATRLVTRSHGTFGPSDDQWTLSSSGVTAEPAANLLAAPPSDQPAIRRRMPAGTSAPRSAGLVSSPRRSFPAPRPARGAPVRARLARRHGTGTRCLRPVSIRPRPWRWTRPQAADPCLSTGPRASAADEAGDKVYDLGREDWRGIGKRAAGTVRAGRAVLRPLGNR